MYTRPYAGGAGLNSTYNCADGRAEIGHTLHPLRWAAGAALLLPVGLAVACLVARLNGNIEISRQLVRWLRGCVATELLVLAAVSIVGLFFEHRAREQDARLYKAPGRLIDVGGFRLHLYCTGSGGPTVILEHGHSATYLDWFRVQPEIAEFARVCSYDRAGYGWSDLSPQARVPSVMAEELHTLLHNAGEKPPYVLVAHSFGGLNAVMFAHKFPDEVAGLVLVDSSVPDSLGRASWKERLWIRTLQFTTHFGLPRWRGWCGGGPKETAGEKRALTCLPRYYETVLREDSGFVQTAAETRGITSLGSVPLIVVARDPSVGQNPQAESHHNEEQREITKLSTNSRFVIAEGSAHDVPLARPDVIVNAVRSLITVRAQAGSRGTP